MGKALFALNGGRFENQLVELAGGVSVNKELELDGRPGETITAETLNALNPDVIFISSFLSNTVDDFYTDCLHHGIQVEAFKHARIFSHPYPNIDFGSPRWVLGLMHIANSLHPDRFHFDVAREAEHFYRSFYQCNFVPGELNLSFAKPHNKWSWERDFLTEINCPATVCLLK